MEGTTVQSDRTRWREVRSMPARVNEPALRVQPDSQPELQYGGPGSRLPLYGQFTHGTASAVGSEYNVAVEPSSAEFPAPVEEITIPTLQELSRSHARVTLNARRLISPLWAIIVSKALQTNFPVREGKLDVEHDVDEKTDKVALRIYAAASAAQTIAFWDSLSVELDKWLAWLRPMDRSIFLNDIGLRFHWQMNV